MAICKKQLKGSALAYGLVIMTVVLIILTSILTYIASQIKFSSNRLEREKAFQVAEAGIYYYRWYLAHATDGMNVQQLKAFWESNSTLGVAGDYSQDYTDPETGESVGTYTIHLETPPSYSTVVTITSTGVSHKMPDVQRKIKVRFRRPSWSEYIFLSNSFMNFGDEAVVYGKIHSNYGIRFDGLAYNTVSALPAKFDDPSHGSNNGHDSKDFGVHTHKSPGDPYAPAANWPWADGTVPSRPDVFVGGRQFPVPEVSFNGVTANLTYMKSQAQSGGGQYFDSTGIGRKITLKNDGTYNVCTVSSQHSSHEIANYGGIVSGASGSYSQTNGNPCTTNSCCAYDSCPYIQVGKPSEGKCVSLENYPIVDNGIIFVEDNAWVEGSINNKRVSIAAANSSGDADIYIGISNIDLRVASYDCNNVIGLVAQRDIRVLNDCPSNFTVDAALLAQTGLVGIVSGMGGKYSFTFNGAIASFKQPFFQEGNSGFADRTYNFNNRLLYCPPPYFPTGTEYAIDLWEEL